MSVKSLAVETKVRVRHLDNRGDCGMPSIAIFIENKYLNRKIGDKGTIIRMSIISGRDIAFVRNKQGLVSAYLTTELEETG